MSQIYWIVGTILVKTENLSSFLVFLLLPLEEMAALVYDSSSCKFACVLERLLPTGI